MIALGTLLVFVPAAALVAISPGANNLLALRNGVHQGTRDAMFALSGRALAFLSMVGLVAVGLASVLARSQLAFAAVKWAGVAYLALLGSRLLLRPGAPHHEDAVLRTRSRFQLARQEFFVAAGNPKALLLFTAFLPQFVDRHGAAWAQLLVLGPLYILIELCAASVWAALGASLGVAAISRRTLAWFERVTGVAFLGLAAGLVVADQ